MRVSIAVLGLVVAAEGIAAQPSPYVAHQHREIKAVSAEEREALLRGDGLALALAAELNGYPGPRHVEELADSLRLTPGQLARVRTARARMVAAAQRLGRSIVAAEAALDSLFAGEAATEAEVSRRSTAIALLRGRLRAVHLVAHLEMWGVLTERQRAAYQRFRGYHDGPPGESRSGVGGRGLRE